MSLVQAYLSTFSAFLCFLCHSLRWILPTAACLLDDLACAPVAPVITLHGWQLHWHAIQPAATRPFPSRQAARHEPVVACAGAVPDPGSIGGSANSCVQLRSLSLSSPYRLHAITTTGTMGRMEVFFQRQALGSYRPGWARTFFAASLPETLMLFMPSTPLDSNCGCCSFVCNMSGLAEALQKGGREQSLLPSSTIIARWFFLVSAGCLMCRGLCGQRKATPQPGLFLLRLTLTASCPRSQMAR